MPHAGNGRRCKPTGGLVGTAVFSIAVELTSADLAQMENPMSSDDLPPGSSDEELGVLPSPPPYRLDHWLWLLSVQAGNAEVRPEQTTDFIRLLNDPNIPLIRYYALQIQVRGIVEWTLQSAPQNVGRLVDWLCAKDRKLTEWRAHKIALSELAERLKAEATKASSEASNEWSRADMPSQWAKVLGINTRTFIRRCKSGDIRHRKLSAKSYQIAIADLPAARREHFRGSSN